MNISFYQRFFDSISVLPRSFDGIPAFSAILLIKLTFFSDCLTKIKVFLLYLTKLVFFFSLLQLFDDLRFFFRYLFMKFMLFRQSFNAFYVFFFATFCQNSRFI